MKWKRSTYRFMKEVKHFFLAEPIRFMPFYSTLRNYSWPYFRADMKAAMNVTMLALPQAMAYSALAGLPIVYGILSAAIAALVAPLFSGSSHTVMGPSNATAFMLLSFTASSNEFAQRPEVLLPLLVLMIGVIGILAALFRMADLLQYVSRSVLVGYISGAAVLIFTDQLKTLLGVAGVVEKQASASFLSLIIQLYHALSYVDWVPITFGACTWLIFISFKKWKPSLPAFAISIFLASLMYAVCSYYQVAVLNRVQTYQTFGFDSLTLKVPNLLNTSIFSDIALLISLAFALVFLASLENIMMAKTLASKTGEKADVHQDLFAVGMANFITAIGGGMPASGSLTRSMLNHASGAKTRFASLFCGLYTLAFAFLIAGCNHFGIKLIDFVPRAALAVLIMHLSCSLFNWHYIKICLRSTRDDAFVLLSTFFATLIAPLHVAIFIGVGISIILFLKKASKPYLVEYNMDAEGGLSEIRNKASRSVSSISIIHVEGNLFFAAAEIFRDQIQRVSQDPDLKVVILRLKNAHHLDATSVIALEDLIYFMRQKNLYLLISGASKEVYKVLKHSGILNLLQSDCNRNLKESNLFLDNPKNPNLAIRNCLKRAQYLLGDEKAEVRIFYDPQLVAKNS